MLRPIDQYYLEKEEPEKAVCNLLDATRDLPLRKINGIMKDVLKLYRSG